VPSYQLSFELEHGFSASRFYKPTNRLQTYTFFEQDQQKHKQHCPPPNKKSRLDAGDKLLLQEAYPQNPIGMN
jgi:hypothetical protein